MNKKGIYKFIIGLIIVPSVIYLSFVVSGIFTVYSSLRPIADFIMRLVYALAILMAVIFVR